MDLVLPQGHNPRLRRRLGEFIKQTIVQRIIIGLILVGLIKLLIETEQPFLCSGLYAVAGLVMVKLDPLNPRMDRHSRTRERK